MKRSRKKGRTATIAEPAADSPRIVVDVLEEETFLPDGGVTPAEPSLGKAPEESKSAPDADAAPPEVAQAPSKAPAPPELMSARPAEAPAPEALDETLCEDTGDASQDLWAAERALAAADRRDPPSVMQGAADWLWSLRAPILLLGLIALVPKLVLLWILIIVAKPVGTWLYRHSPQKFKTELQRALPAFVRKSAFVRDVGEGADQGLPFVLFFLYLFCAPFALTWIAVHWVQGFMRPAQPEAKSGERLVFAQNKQNDSSRSEANFYHSKAFGIVVMLFFLLGIPAFFTYAVYDKTGIAQMMNSAPPAPVRPVLIPKSPMPAVGQQALPDDSWYYNLGGDQRGNSRASHWPWLRNFGVEPSQASVFFVDFYLISVATAMCALFFRTWFTFPLNFLHDEHNIEVTESGIKRDSFKSWFLHVITLNKWAIGGGPDSLRWKEVRSLRRLEDGFTRLYPLPETMFKRETLTYRSLNKVAAFIDGISNQWNKGKYLVFSTTDSPTAIGQSIKVNLNDLDRQQRARLFYAVRKWAPHVSIQESAEEQLLGSIVLRDERYTQLWFDMLTYKSRDKKRDVLPSGARLKDGEYKVEERISSGGQATTYLAQKASGEQCVLKEFILASNLSSGALIESAREFEAEVSVLSQLDHPGIVRLENFFCEAGRLYAVLEYIPGRSLRQLVQESGALSEEEVIRIGESVCGVLEYLHSFNPPIVHRDVTPENILVMPDGTVKLIDFSLAVKQDGQKPTESCAKQCFTPPEQFRDEVCTQSDIYALGATMFFLLTGKTPKPISRSSPKAKAPHLSDEIDAVVAHATELDLKQRYDAILWMKLELSRMIGKASALSN